MPISIEFDDKDLPQLIEFYTLLIKGEQAKIEKASLDKKAYQDKLDKLTTKPSGVPFTNQPEGIKHVADLVANINTGYSPALTIIGKIKYVLSKSVTALSSREIIDRLYIINNLLFHIFSQFSIARLC